MLKIKRVKSVLFYPGGKARVIKQILPIIPNDFLEYREPFIGGGSVFANVKMNVKPNARYRINDIDYSLYCFWKQLRDKNEELHNVIMHAKTVTTDWEKLYSDYIRDINSLSLSQFDMAVRYFILNKLEYSGLINKGGYVKNFETLKFNIQAIERLREYENILKDVEITNESYERLLSENGEDVFLFLDPPYYSQRKSRLYGKDGELHLAFNHEEFADNVRKCKHRFLITLDDCEHIRELFSFANIYTYEVLYTMSKDCKIGKELFICNYDIPDSADEYIPQEQNEFYQTRKDIISLVSQGMARKEIAEILNVSEIHISKTKSAYSKQGFEGIKSKRKGRKDGEQTKLSDRRENIIKQLLIEETPKQYGLSGNLWTRQNIIQLVWKRFKVRLIPSTAGYLLERWGLGLDVHLNELRLKYCDYETVKGQSIKAKGCIYWSGIRRIENFIDTEERATAIYAISNQGRLHFAMYNGKLDSDRVTDFLNRLKENENRKVFLFTNESWSEYSELISKNIESIEFFY
jgi:DNA adenine methylase